MNKVSFKKSMDKMAIHEPDYGGFGVFFNLKRNFELKKKGNIFEKSNEFFFI